MILENKGILSSAQDYSSTEDSENVIQMSATNYVGMTDLWWTVITTTIAATAGTIKVALVAAQEAALDNTVEICSVLLAAITDNRVDRVGGVVAAFNVGKVIKDMLAEDGSSYPYIGMIVTCEGSTTVSFDASLSPTEPQTSHHAQIVDSNVTVPAVASADSGE